MNGKFYSVEEISSILDIHPKTVQRYIREGKIKATKVGKAWRVMEKDFKVFMNVTDSDSNLTHVEKSLEPQNTYDFIKVSSVVDISVKSTEDAIKIANILTASLNGQHETHGKSSLNIQFIEPENKVRVMLWGNIKFMETMMSFMSDYLENYVG